MGIEVGIVGKKRDRQRNRRMDRKLEENTILEIVESRIDHILRIKVDIVE